MEITTLTAFISPFLPFLLKLGGKALEKSTESASGKFGEAAFAKAQAVWGKLEPKVEAKEAAKEAAIDVANNPSDRAKLVLEVQLEKLLKQDEELKKSIEQIFKEDAPDGTSGTQIVQNVTGDRNQVIGRIRWDDYESDIGIFTVGMLRSSFDVGEFASSGVDSGTDQKMNYQLEELDERSSLYPLWCGTNRKLIDQSDVSKGFSAERDDRVHYGSCQVAVPKSHKIGSVGSPWWERLLKLEDDRLKLDRNSLHEMISESFWESIKRTLAARELGERTALVFIHGFNVSFEEAALRAAQIGFDLQIPGITAFYSWPSKGKLDGYTADEATIQASEGYIADFLTHFVTSAGAERVHIIAHSMGNRGLLRSLPNIITQVQLHSNISFGQIILAAPDEDPDVFRNLARNYQSIAERTTLYVSAKDKALAASGIIHDFPRAGFTPPIMILPGIDTVEVSNIDLTLLGHGYHSDARGVLQDMHQLLDNHPPEKRFGLEEVQVETQKYWIIRQ